MRLLLNAKADPQLAPEGSTFTPLEGALAAKSASVMRLLIAAGAKPANSQLIATFIHTARSAGRPRSASLCSRGARCPTRRWSSRRATTRRRIGSGLRCSPTFARRRRAGLRSLSASASLAACRSDIPIGLGMSLLTHSVHEGRGRVRPAAARGARVAARGGRRAAAVVLASRRVCVVAPRVRRPAHRRARAGAMSIGAAAHASALRDARPRRPGRRRARRPPHVRAPPPPRRPRAQDGRARRAARRL